MFKGLKNFIVVSLSFCAVFSCFALAHASSTVDQSSLISSKDIIMVLFGLLQTVFMGIGLWLISNDKELFTRLRIVESDQVKQSTTCQERSGDCGTEHVHRRAADNDPQLALKESVDNLRKLLFTIENKEG